VNIAPSAAKMVDSGKARMFEQANSPEVITAVKGKVLMRFAFLNINNYNSYSSFVVLIALLIKACPVSCMHTLSFNELKEMEIARDIDDGLAYGVPTPLHVSKISSDNNHRTSSYHHIKKKCYHSKSCPQKGCFDCPLFERGENPNFKIRHLAAEKVRANDIMESGEGDSWRTIAEL